MKKYNLERKNGRSHTKIEYDDTEYNIRYKHDFEDGDDSFILKRLSDGEILKVFRGDVTDIIQCNKNGKTYFAVTDWNDYDETGLGKFTCYENVNSKDLLKTFSCECVQCTRVSDNSFSLQLHDKGFGIYNLECFNDYYARVYDHPNAINAYKQWIGEDVLFVREDKEAFPYFDVKDTIYYGIDPETLEIKTKIWSELQDRYIDILTEEEYEKRKEDLSRQDIHVRPSSNLIGDKTIATEVMGTLILLARYLDDGNKHTLDTSNVNKEFVKGFKITNKK